MPPALTGDLIERLRSRSTTNPETGCWIWAGPLKKGYGTVTVAPQRQKRVHIAAWEYFNGKTPDGMELDHLCHTNSDCDLGDYCPHRACWNPEHLEPVSHATNVLRGRSASAKNAVKTQCIRGHLLSLENVYVTGNGNRSCKPCRRDVDRERAGRRADQVKNQKERLLTEALRPKTGEPFHHRRTKRNVVVSDVTESQVAYRRGGLGGPTFSSKLENFLFWFRPGISGGGQQ